MAELNASGANFHILSKENLETLFFAGFGEGYTDENISAYLDHWQYVNAYRDAMRRAYRHGESTAFLCHEHISEEDWARGGYFMDFFAKINQRWLAGGIAWSGRKTEVSVAFSRSCGAPHFGEKEGRFITQLLPHVRRAARLALEFGASHGARLEGGLLSARMPTFLVDNMGSVQWMNVSGEELIAQSGGIAVRQGRLRLADPDAGRDLARLIANAVDKRLAETPPGVLHFDAGADAYEIEVLPATVPAGALIGAHSLATVMVRPLGLNPSVIDKLKQRHGLTEAESRLAMMLAEGGSVEEAASEGGVSQHTVRTQLRSIFSKTGVNRQSALAALVWKSA